MVHADILGERARITPRRTALISAETGQRWTYGELDRRAAACALAWTHSCGLRPGERVGFLAHNRVEHVEAFFAAIRSGAILVPLSYRLTAVELAYQIEHSGMRALLYAGELAETVAELRRRVQLERWIALDDRVEPGDLSHAELLAAAEGSWSAPRPDPEQICCLIYTSGTTGKPKAVMLPQRMIAWNAYNTVASWQLRETDVSPVFTPFYHAAGYSVFLCPLFVIGGAVVLHREFDATTVLRAMERERCTVVLGVPTIFQLLLDHPEIDRVNLSHLRWLISGGAPLPPALVEAFGQRGVTLKQGYGMTEVGVNCFTMTEQEARLKAGSIGRPMMLTEARLVDPEGNPVPSGEVGELQLRGPHVCAGYWNDPEATAAALDPQGWFHTGDLARQDDEGLFYIAGRKKEMYISGGVNIYPAEIEAALLEHPEVADAAVVGVPDARWGEVGAAFVVPRAPGALDPLQLAAHLTQRLARFKLPRQVHLLEELPRTAYGKVQKQLLMERFKENNENKQ